jgi:predicted metal-dependent hydrolase
VTVFRNGEVKVSAPYHCSTSAIERFVSQHKEWIVRKRDHFLKHPVTAEHHLLHRRSRAEYKKNKEQARIVMRERVRHFNQHYRFTVGSIAIRNQRSRWGSCSKKGNLNFNYKIVFLPPELQDYIVVHELCHLGQFNHSRKFWELVAEQMPEWRELRRRLRGM